MKYCPNGISIRSNWTAFYADWMRLCARTTTARRHRVAGRRRPVCLRSVFALSALVRYPITGVAAAQVLAWQAGILLSTPAIWLAHALSWDRPTRSAVTLSIPTVNVASYGVPVATFALGDEALSIVMLLFVYGNVFGSSLGVYIAAGGRQRPQQALSSVFKLPLIYTAALAIGINAWAYPFPSGCSV